MRLLKLMRERKPAWFCQCALSWMELHCAIVCANKYGKLAIEVERTGEGKRERESSFTKVV